MVWDPGEGTSHPQVPAGGSDGPDGSDGSADAPEVVRLERRLRLLAEHLPDMIFRYEYLPVPRFDYVSPASTTISGYTPEDHYRNPDLISELIHPDDRDLVLSGVADPRDDPGEPIVLRWLHRDGHVVVTEQRFSLERDPDDRVVAIEGVVRDVTARLRRQAELEHEATHDPITGLANSRLVEEHLNRHLRGDHGPLVVIVVRLDRLAITRDLVGRRTAEAVVRAAAARIREVAPAGALVAKGADDLFWLVYPQAGRDAGDELIARVQSSFRDPLHAEGREVYVSTTAGGRLVEVGSTSGVEEILNDADTALRAVSGRGGPGRSRWFDSDLYLRATARLALEHDLRGAVADGDIALVFQPQYDLEAGRIVGFEALARWDRSGHGPVSPEVFVTVAEETGLIGDLGDHVLFVAARQFVRWSEQGLVDRQRVSINVSRRQLGLPDFAESVLEIVGAAGLRLDRLTMEVTETAVMDGGVDAWSVLARLKAAGVRISLDDFGTGHSSLRALRDLPVDELKIDRAFVATVIEDDAAAAICAAIVALGRGLSLDLVAEGVETPAQSRRLLEMGCRVGQGFHFSRPLHPSEATALLAQHRTATHEPPFA